MPHSNGQSHCPHCSPPTPAPVTVSILPGEMKFLEMIREQKASSLAASVSWVHDLLLYHSDVDLGRKEKWALLDLRLILEGLEGI